MITIKTKIYENRTIKLGSFVMNYLGWDKGMPVEIKVNTNRKTALIKEDEETENK